MRRRTPVPADPNIVSNRSPRIMIYDYHQDDPRKCTATKLEKFHLAQPLRSLRQIPRGSIVLNPVSSKTMSFEDRIMVQRHGLVALDCSWNRADSIFQDNIKGEDRRLPTLLAGNPTNYSSRGRLSTVEALAAALIITGFDTKAQELLELFRWGSTFLTLNKEPLQEYAKTPAEKMIDCERNYFPAE